MATKTLITIVDHAENLFDALVTRWAFTQFPSFSQRPRVSPLYMEIAPRPV